MCTVLIRARAGGFSTMRRFNEKTNASKGRKWRRSIKETRPAARKNWTPPPRRLPQVMRSNRAYKTGLTLGRSLAARIDGTLGCGGLAPPPPFRATRCIPDIRTREAFADQDAVSRLVANSHLGLWRPRE